MDTELKSLKEHIARALSMFQEEVGGIRTNRPTAGLVDGIPVEYEGQTFPIKQLGSISIQPPRDIQVSVWDKTFVPFVVKAIEASGKGLNPSVSGNVIHMTLPAMTEERREEFVKLAKAAAERFRIQLRALRDDSNKMVEKAESDKDINEDEKFKLKKQIQTQIDEANGVIETALDKKITDIRL